MKTVYILLADVDYEASSIIRVCSKKADAERRLAWLKEHKFELRSAGYKDESPLMREWRAGYGDAFTGDDYHMEEWQVSV